MTDIVCKYCNKTVVMKLEGDGEVDQAMQFLIDKLKNTPCSKCVPTPVYLDGLTKGKTSNAIFNEYEAEGRN